MNRLATPNNLVSPCLDCQGIIKYMKTKKLVNVSKPTAVKQKNALVVIAVMFIISLLWLVAMRFILLKPEITHYHANFAVFVNGEQLPFDNFTFYEEVQSCSGDELTNPRTRVHMHEQISHIIHVHDNASTWGHFFANLGFSTGDNVFKTDKGVYVESAEISIRYMLNNQEVDTIANRVIGSEDTLLVSINNNTDNNLDMEYSQITKEANEYNLKQDPASCSGGSPWTTSERLKNAIDLF